jgi:hypothetical protein
MSEALNTLGVEFDNLTVIQRDSLTLPAKGMLIFNVDDNRIERNDGTPSVPDWVPIYAEKTIQVNLPALGQVVVPQVNQENYMFANVEFFLFTKIVPSQILTPDAQPGVGGPGPIGNTGNVMNDNNNFGNICYNNFAAASTNDLAFYTMDMGAPIPTPDRLVIKWWQFNNYVANSFRVEASNVWDPDPLNTANWTTILGGLTGTNIIGNFQYINLPPAVASNYQYWRVFCEQGFPAGIPFMVVNEMTLQTAQTIYRSIEDYDDVTFFFDGSGQLTVQNLDNVNTTLTVRYRL